MCCGKFYTCRRCHDEDTEKACLVDFDRHAVAEVKCLHCGLEQPVAQTCRGCQVVFGTYFCPVCRFFDNVDKGQFHCEGCGICRVGGRANFQHCDRCRVCYSLEAIASHTCVDKAMGPPLVFSGGRPLPLTRPRCRWLQSATAPCASRFGPFPLCPFAADSPYRRAMQYLHTTTRNLHVPNCGHILHRCEGAGP